LVSTYSFIYLLIWTRAGSKNPRVLPLPVSAIAIQSLSAKIIGHD